MTRIEQIKINGVEPQHKQSTEMGNNEINRNEFNENVAITLSALNGLMQTTEVCKADKAVLKINRFKMWVLELAEHVDAKRNTATATPEKIVFNPSDCPEVID